VELHHRYCRNDPNAGLNTYPKSHTDTNPCTDTNAGTDSYACADTNTDTNTHPNANTSGYWYYPGYGK
jgi:hypothetical protein